METTNSGNNDYKLIPLTRGKFAKVDPWNYERLMQHKWRVLKSGRTYYAIRSTPREKGVTRGVIFMHLEIRPVREGFETDHKDRDGLNNREENLREATHLQNLMNLVRKTEGKSSKYKGVYWRTNRSCWVAQIQVNRKRKHLGNFNCEVDAACCYDDEAYRVYGFYAYLNFPERFKSKVLQDKDYEKNNLDKGTVCIS